MELYRIVLTFILRSRGENGSNDTAVVQCQRGRTLPFSYQNQMPKHPLVFAQVELLLNHS